jgi:hypothetical protein
MGGSGPAPGGGPGSSATSGPDGCPSKISTVIAGPASGLLAGAWLDVSLDRTTEPPRVVLVDAVLGRPVGSLAGVPDLATLIRCLTSGVQYRAYVDRVDGGRVEITVIRE